MYYKVCRAKGRPLFNGNQIRKIGMVETSELDKNEKLEANMKIFKKPNIENGWKCPICNTSKEKEVVLVGIIGTENGNNIQAEQIHLDCIELSYDKKYDIIYQRIK